MANLITAVVAWFKRPTVERAAKTFAEATVTQATLYTTVVPNPPDVRVSAAVSVGATFLAVVLNLAIQWATKAKSAKLDQLAAAIDAVVDKRLAEQSVSDKPPA